MFPLSRHISQIGPSNHCNLCSLTLPTWKLSTSLNGNYAFMYWLPWNLKLFSLQTPKEGANLPWSGDLFTTFNRHYNRQRPIWVKRTMSNVPIFRQKNPISNSNVQLFTRIRMQCWHVNSLGTVLSETVLTMSLSAPPTIVHIWRWADISNITTQTMLGICRVGYSCWWLIAGYMCEVLQYGICRRYYGIIT